MNDTLPIGIGPSRGPARILVLAGLLVLLAMGAMALGVWGEGEDLQLGQVAYSRFDIDNDGLMDAVEVIADVNNVNSIQSRVFTLEVVLTSGTVQVDLKTAGARLDPLGSTTVTLEVGTGTDTSSGTYTVMVVLHEEYLQGPVMDEDETTVELWPLGEYDIDLEVNRTSAEAMENTSVGFTVTLSSGSNNPTDVEIDLTSSLGWPYQLEMMTVAMEPQQERAIGLTVLVPHNAPPGSFETLELEAVALRNATAFATLTLTVMVDLQDFKLSLELTTSQVFIASGETTTASGFVTNGGNNVDNATLIADLPHGWVIAFEPPFLLIDRGDTLGFDMLITAPSYLTDSGSMDVNITALSKGLVAQDVRELRVVYNTAELLIDTGNVTIIPHSPSAGDEVTVQATVRNAGAVTASGVEVALVTDDGEVTRVTLATLPPGAIGVATLKWTPPPGSHLVRVVVDPDGKVVEVDEENNVASLTVKVISADLSVVPSDITIDPSYPTEGSETTVRVVVNNLRPLVAGAFKVELIVDDGSIGTQEATDGLVGDGNVTFEWTWTAVPGRHTFVVEVDIDGAVQEEDRSNNMATRSFTVNQRPDPVLRLSVEEVRTGEVLTLDGSGSTDPDGRVRLYFFDYGDGSDSGWTFFATVNHSYTEPGEYVIRLHIKDEVEAQSEDPMAVTVKVTRPDTGDETTPGPGALMALLAIAVVTATIARLRGRKD